MSGSNAVKARKHRFNFEPGDQFVSSNGCVLEILETLIHDGISYARVRRYAQNMTDQVLISEYALNTYLISGRIS
jgi:hypothetical protein